MAKYKGQMALLATVSFLGALLEALFLVILTGVAMALVSGESSVGPYLGRSLSVNVAFLVAAAVLLVRLGLNLSGVQISAGLTADITKEQRRLLSQAYLTTSWTIQASEPTDRLQELLMSFVSRASNAVAVLTNVIVAHRISNLRMCNRILDIVDGRMTSCDKPEALRERSAFYRNALAVAGIS